MKKQTTITPFKRIVKGKERYGIDIIPISGKRKRTVFATREERDEEMEYLLTQRRETGDLWSTLSARERAEIGFMLMEAKEAGFTLRQAFDFFKAGGAPGSSTKTGIAYNAFIAEKEKERISKKTLAAIKSNVGRFVSGFSHLALAQIKRDDIALWLRNPEWGPRTYNSYLISIKTFFSWCVSTEKLLKSPAATIKKISKKQMPDIDVEPTVLNIDQCRRLLKAALEIDRPLLPYIAVGLFAGLRPMKEAGNLMRSDIEAAQILVRGANAKDRQRRHVDVHPTLLKWLKLSLRAKATFPPKNLRKRLDQVRARAGLVRLCEVKDEYRFTVEWTGWDQDCLRHTFASHYLPLNSSDKTISQMGHGDYSMLFSHYRKLVSKAEAEKFWNELTPEKIIPSLFNSDAVVVNTNTKHVADEAGGEPVNSHAVYKPESWTPPADVAGEDEANPEADAHGAVQREDLEAIA